MAQQLPDRLPANFSYSFQEPGQKDKDQITELCHSLNSKILPLRVDRDLRHKYCYIIFHLDTLADNIFSLEQSLDKNDINLEIRHLTKLRDNLAELNKPRISGGYGIKELVAEKKFTDPWPLRVFKMLSNLSSDAISTLDNILLSLKKP